MTAQPSPAVSLQEIRHLAQELPVYAPVAVPAVPVHGRAQEALLWLAQVQGKMPELRRTRLALFAGAHGCLPDSAALIRPRLSALTTAHDSVVKALTAVDADLRLYELDLEHPTHDFRSRPALDETAAAHAMAYGMMAVEPGLQLLALAGLGAGGELAHGELLRRLPESSDPLQTLTQTGGLECCAVIGALLAARLARVPVLCEGLAAEAALAVLQRLNPAACSHIQLARTFESEADSAQIGLASALAMGRVKVLAALV